MMPTIDDQIAEVSREIALREAVYRKWVLTGRLTQQKADQRIACMKAVLSTLTNALRSRKAQAP